MVYFFTSNGKTLTYWHIKNQISVVDPPVTLFVGADKHENEELLRWGWPEDVWFHVDKVSSAHVYIRLPKNQNLEEIPVAVLEDAAQLVKANSISGHKMDAVDVVYTKWTNLKKTGDMDVGQVKVIRGVGRRNEIINRLNRTRQERSVDLAGERMHRDCEERLLAKQLLKEQKKQQRKEDKRKKEEAEMSLMDPEKMISNQDGYDSDDFM